MTSCGSPIRGTRPAPGAHRQRGMTLVVSLVMLLMLTMFALSTMNLSNSNLKVVGNQQAQRAVEAAAQQAIEQVISGSAVFKTGAQIAQTFTIDGFTVAVTAPVCQRAVVATGGSENIEIIVPEMALFEIQASTTDAVSGATVSVRQGVDLMLPSGNCT